MTSGIELINRIDEILSEKGKTRKDFAKEINIQPNTMGNWKTNNSMPPADTINQIAKVLGVTTDWLLNGSKEFEEQEQFFNQYSRHAIRLRIYEALKNKYEKDDNRFASDYLNNESLLREIHNDYLNDGKMTYEVLLYWSKGRCEINTYFFDQWAQSLNTTLQFILTGSELLIPSDSNYSKPFDKNLYDLALKYRNELNCLNRLTEERKQSGITILNQLMRLENLEYAENKKNENVSN